MSGFRHPQATPARNYNDMQMRMPKQPERPLQPYMRYSRKMWPRVRAERPEAQLWDIGKIIGEMWQKISDTERSMYQHEFEMERVEYEKQMKHFQNSGMNGFMAAKGRAKQNEKVSRSRMDAGGVVIQPVDEDDGTNEMSTRRLAGVRYERNNRLISDLFSPSMVTDTRSIVPHQRMELLKRQAASLGAHQSKLEEELAKLERTHDERKRQIEKSGDEFQEQLMKVVNDKPVVDESKFEESVKEWEEKLAAAYVEYKKKVEENNAAASAAKENSAPLLRNLVMEESEKKTEATDEKKTEEKAEEKKDEEVEKEEEEEKMEGVEEEKKEEEEEKK